MEARRFSTGGLARALGVSPTTVRKWESRGLLPASVRLEGSDRRLFDVVDLDAIRARIDDRRRNAHDGAAPIRAREGAAA